MTKTALAQKIYKWEPNFMRECFPLACFVNPNMHAKYMEILFLAVIGREPRTDV